MRLLTTTLLTAATFVAANGGAFNLITNGTFETGSVAGWTPVTNPGFGNITGSCNQGFAAESMAVGCKAGINPASGSFAAYASSSFPAVANSVGEWDNYLSQSVVVPTGITSAILSWSDTATWSGSGSFRGVDQLTALLQNGNYLANANAYTVSNPSSDGSNPWSTHTIDVTSPLQGMGGQTITVQLASLIFFDTRSGTGSSNTAAILGWDNVQLNITTPSAAPEPATLGVTGVGLIGVFLVRRRRPAR